MSLPTPPKNMQIYIVMLVLFGGGTLFNQTNSGVTEDKIDSIEQRIVSLEEGHSMNQNNDAVHEGLFAHAGIFERTNQIMQVIDGVEERVRYLERLFLDID